MTPELGLQLLCLLATAVLALLAWGLKRSVADVDRRLVRMETDLRQAASSIGAHSERLAAGDVELRGLRDRVQGLEDRERARGCFGACHLSKG